MHSKIKTIYKYILNKKYISKIPLKVKDYGRSEYKLIILGEEYGRFYDFSIVLEPNRKIIK